jgi:hypothetical protein
LLPQACLGLSRWLPTKGFFILCQDLVDRIPANINELVYFLKMFKLTMRGYVTCHLELASRASVDAWPGLAW